MEWNCMSSEGRQGDSDTQQDKHDVTPGDKERDWKVSQGVKHDFVLDVHKYQWSLHVHARTGGAQHTTDVNPLLCYLTFTLCCKRLLKRFIMFPGATLHPVLCTCQDSIKCRSPFITTCDLEMNHTALSLQQSLFFQLVVCWVTGFENQFKSNRKSASSSKLKVCASLFLLQVTERHILLTVENGGLQKHTQNR